MLLVTVATGVVTKGLEIYLETIPGKRSVDCVQKTAETWSLNGGVHHWFKWGSTREKETCDKRWWW